MRNSACGRDAKRRAIAKRISECAQRLTDEHGIDGFTLEDLAEASDVSRRTLFNYFPGKLDAVLGTGPHFEEAALEQFRSGGPHQDLVEDLAVLAHTMLAEEGIGRDELARHRRRLRANPKLMAAAHDGFESISEQMVAEILVREGPSFDARRARVAIGMLVALFDLSLDLFLTDNDKELADLFTDSLRTARELLA